jgi:hypothetical protein
VTQGRAVDSGENLPFCPPARDMTILQGSEVSGVSGRKRLLGSSDRQTRRDIPRGGFDFLASASEA